MQSYGAKALAGTSRSSCSIARTSRSATTAGSSPSRIVGGSPQSARLARPVSVCGGLASITDSPRGRTSRASARDDAVQPSERLGCRDDERLRGSLIGEVERKCVPLADAEVAEPAPVAPGRGKVRAAVRECGREGFSHAARGPDDQNPCPAERSGQGGGGVHREVFRLSVGLARVSWLKDVPFGPCSSCGRDLGGHARGGGVVEPAQDGDQLFRGAAIWALFPADRRGACTARLIQERTPRRNMDKR